MNDTDNVPQISQPVSKTYPTTHTEIKGRPVRYWFSEFYGSYFAKFDDLPVSAMADSVPELLAELKDALGEYLATQEL